jgi:hypothetical protein
MARALAHSHIDRAAERQLVYAVAEAPGDEYHWAKTIIELGDGRSVREIIETIYRDELSAGAWMADIGLWSDLYAREVTEAIHDLAIRGYIVLRDPGCV